MVAKNGLGASGRITNLQHFTPGVGPERARALNSNPSALRFEPMERFEILLSRAVRALAAVAAAALLVTACQAPSPAVETPASDTAAADSTFDPEARLAELGITLPGQGAPIANYVNAVRTGNLLFLAGKGPSLPDGGYVTGKIPTDLAIEDGYEAARLTAIQHISVLKSELGDLRRVRRIVKVTGMVNSAPDFTAQPSVINGYSDLMVAVFGDRGRHARAAVGMASLPMGMVVEVDVVVEVE